MGSMVRRGFSGASLSDERFTDLDFADDAVIFAETMQELTGFLEALQRSPSAWDCASHG